MNSSEHGRKMAFARWKRKRCRDQFVDPEVLADLLSNSVPREGDAIGSLEWRDFRSGQVMRWTVLRGDRVDRVMLRHPDGRKTKSHGWTWIMDHLRGHFAGRKVYGDFRSPPPAPREDGSGEVPSGDLGV